MIPSYLAGEILRQRTAEAIERGDRSRLVAAAKKASRERRRAAKAASKRPAPDITPTPNVDPAPAGNAERDSVMSC